ncbi:MAG: hypothetical protein QG594_205 [Bacteroidota bacterium]|nr:hypothetical protein [Bacteroidota bacterium]
MSSTDLLKENLFETNKGFSYQCNQTNTIVIHFGETVATYKVKDFLIFQRKINSLNILDMLYDLSDNCDFKLIETTKKNFSRNLTICEIIQLRELLNGTKFTLVLNSMLNQILNEELV